MQYAALDMFLRSFCQTRHLSELKNLLTYENLAYTETGRGTLVGCECITSMQQKPLAVTQKGILEFMGLLAKVGAI